MSLMIFLNMAACFVVFAWATWCALSPRVKDGILGKLMFAVLALSALGMMLGPNGWYGGRQAAETTLHLAMALLCLRHLTMKLLWPRIVRRVRCAMCPKKGI